MMTRMLKAKAFKQVQQLFAKGKIDKAVELLEDLQAEYVSLCDENKSLRSQLAEVAEVLDMSENMEFDGQKYWVVEDDVRQGPYCQLCYDRDGLLIHLQEKQHRLLCHGCGSHFPKTQPVEDEEKSSARQDERRIIHLFAK